MLVPLTGSTLFADVFADWQLPVILCARTALGGINHALLSLEALKVRNCLVHGVIFVGDEMSRYRADHLRDWRRAAAGAVADAAGTIARNAGSGVCRAFQSGRFHCNWWIMINSNKLPTKSPDKPRSRSPIWHPFNQHALINEFPELHRGEGAYLYTVEGKRLIDAISSWWVVTHGHCNKRIQSAITRQASLLDQVIFANYTHQPAEDLARALVDLTSEGLDHVFYSDSGSTAVEVALKMALGFWANRADQGSSPARHRLLVLEHGYHGDTIGTMSVGARGVFNAAYEPLLFDVESIPFPAAGREQTDTRCAGSGLQRG